MEALWEVHHNPNLEEMKELSYGLESSRQQRIQKEVANNDATNLEVADRAITGRAPPSGWWECCGGGNGCGREVNPAIWGNACPDCSHEKCDGCT